MTRFTKKPTHFTLPAILPAILTGLFILTACGGSALTNDAPIATNTQKNVCKTNPLADGCQQAGAGFLSVGLDEGIGNQEAESSVAPPAPKPVVNAPVVASAPTPVVKKTEPAPITSVDTHDFVPKTSPSTQSAPAEQRSGSAASGDSGASGQQSAPVTAAATTAFTDLPTTRNATLTNEFLQGGATELDRGDAVRADSLRMNLAQATFDGVAIGGDVADGIDFFTTHYIEDRGTLEYIRITPTFLTTTGTRGDIIQSRYHYAGILAGTDLGEPVDSATGMATWNGSFRTYNTNPVDFQLTVTFGGEGERTISAFVKDTARSKVDNYYLIAGNYNAVGLITSGTVNWGTFSDIAQRTPTASRPTNGTLTGIIGVQGAVAVFISDTNDEATSGGYAGGFVAAPSDRATGNPDVTFSDWTRAIPSVTGGNNGFEAGGVNGLTQTAIPNVISVADCEAHNARFSTITEPIIENFKRTDRTNTITFLELDCTTDIGSLKLAGTKFGEVTDSGVAFVTDGISRTTLTSGKSFAGLLSGTDLGAPISDANQVGEWQGKFKSVGGYYFGGATRDDQYISTAVDTDFTLEVTFGAVGGVPDSAGSIEAFVATHGISRYFLLKGTYDDKGVITGTVLAALFDNHQRSNPSASINGVLTGLIGVEGAVGAFVSNADNHNYAGGFVASPLIPDVEHEVVFADWTRSFATEPATTPTTGTPQSEFLQATGGTLAVGTLKAFGGSDDITVTTLDLNTATLRNNPLGDDADDGVAFYQGYINSDGAGYAGIFDTTDLGRPLTAKDARAEWRGQFQVIQSRKINTDFTLEVTFGAVAGVDGSVGKVEAFVEQIAPNVAYHYVRGTFNNAGVIKGTATAGTFTNGDRNQFNGGPTDGILTGLIGQEGAVGAFYSHTGVYAGGFVALPFVRVPMGTTAFWARNTRTATAGVYPTILPSATATLTKTGSEANDDPQANFMLAGADGLVLGADAKDGVTIATEYNVNLSQLFDGTDAASGFTLEHAQTTDNPTGNPERFNLYVGLLSGTDVGAPFTNANMPFASWTGRLRLESPQAQISFNKEIRFTVGFDGTDGTIITDAIALGAGRQTTNNITINGQFGADGVIFGTTTADLGTGSANVSATLSGLIGVDGAVAVFAGNDASTDGSYAGGFVARPTFTVNYDGWLDSFSETLPTEGHPSDGNDSEFLQSGPIELDTGTITGPFGAPVTNLTLTMDDNTNNGVDFFSGTYVSPRGVENINRHRFYAGILSGTNVGELLAPYTSGPETSPLWNGKLQSVSFLGGKGFPDVLVAFAEEIMTYETKS